MQHGCPYNLNMTKWHDFHNRPQKINIIQKEQPRMKYIFLVQKQKKIFFFAFEHIFIIFTKSCLLKIA